MFKIAVLVSGGGTDLQSVIDAVENKELNVKIEMVIGSRDNIYALERAKKHGIETFVISRKEYGEKASDKILELTKGKVDLIVLAGFLAILDGDILKEFDNKIINIHPSLIPSFCGAGMYGLKVHEAVIKSGVKFSGCTVHFVNSEVDGGAILLQEVVPVYFEDDAETLQKRILEKEHLILPEAIRLISEGKVEFVNGKAKIS
ncbi:phosphoribosylglycinamide formyltransferase-1 [Clostridium saccharoperbutylacetonicum]|uniref:Phosphoribosylglycinamide formyltransferase n=1 Tax=Clostridium saccharoperbutylacetonicum N1-4(HMT) TaxID=931276 RepID=M1MTP8_9CLOT|nr:MULTISPECIES: phosphoribosylglycinamide formyltransferase [Clostridium]AGF54927.1 phosphoribosylglycinamide formyltransferase PurN [Clostridium saccharoperbutylacetonicum N1-4(HMT)]NRT64368.1 phosphoribosylglycinamide formyltransferase-1 [Clostridium saccharoperbutylacetonicum]NSB27737.1 phosphoribosylglycinamide formyltransferase-1 [Clostridium saccharoperbutylacetonicum]NSB41224.1 phosphoribosylglycinamide formyltransferase-1 [Clostridium saccharoperbutylacetonicum]